MEGEASDREHYFDFDTFSEAPHSVYANILGVWYSPYEFALDWGLTEPAVPEDPDDPASGCGFLSRSSHAFVFLQVWYLTCCVCSTKL
jgi:hypothetical protein